MHKVVVPVSYPSGYITGVSSVSLAKEVGATPPGKFRHKMSPVCVKELSGSIHVKAVDVLHQLGKTITPPAPLVGPHDPTLWPIIKYFNFFDEVGDRLHCGAQASWYVEHGRTAVSDELGVAFSLIAARIWMEKTHHSSGVTFHDVEGALAGRYGHGYMGISPQSRRARSRPDWLASGFVSQYPGSRTVCLVESKGTKGATRKNHVSVLGGALDQLGSVTVTNSSGNPKHAAGAKHSPPGLAVRAVTGRGQVEIWSIDPPESGEDVFRVGPPSNLEITQLLNSWSEESRRTDLAGVIEKSNGSLEAESFPAGRASQDPNTSESLPNDGEESSDPRLSLEAEQLSVYLTGMSAVRAVGWSRDVAAAQAVYDTRWPAPESRLEEDYRIDTEAGRAFGRVERIPGTRRGIFLGVLGDVIKPLRDGDFEEYDRARSHIEQGHNGDALGGGVPSKSTYESGLSVDGDGTVLAVVES